MDEIEFRIVPENYEFPKKIFAFRVDEKDATKRDPLRVSVYVKSYRETFDLVGFHLIPDIFKYPFDLDSFNEDLLLAIPGVESTYQVMENLSYYADYFRTLIELLKSDTNHQYQEYLIHVLGKQREDIISIIEEYYTQALAEIADKIRNEVLKQGS